ncbi:MFS transporter [bacterium]|nr:MFS transporter [bacterium]
MTEQKRLQRAALIVAAMSSFLGPFMGSSVNVALPSIGSEFGLGVIQLGWVNTAFLLAAASFVISFGRLGDLFGRKRIYTMGIILFTISSVILAAAGNGAVLITMRVFQGFGSAMIFATGLPILMSVFPPGERGKALGITVAAVYLGLSVGPFIGGLITQQLGWRFVFWMNLPAGLILLTVLLTMLKGEWAEAKGETFDLRGSIILAAALTGSMYGFSVLPSLSGALAIAAGLICFVIFVKYELRVPLPVVNISLFRDNPVFAFSNLAALINYAATFAVSFLLSIYLQRVKGFSPQTAGLVLVAQPIAQMLLSPAAGRLSDKIEPRTLASLGMGISLVGLVLLVPLRAASPIGYILVCLIVLGIGFGLFSSPNTNAVMSSVERKSLGIAGAMVSTMRQIGMMFSMGVVMMVMSLIVGNSEILPADQAHFMWSMRLAFMIFAAMCFGGIFASLARGKLNR